MSWWTALFKHSDRKDLFTVPVDGTTVAPGQPDDSELAVAARDVAACRQRDQGEARNRAALVDALDRQTWLLIDAERTEEAIANYLEMIHLSAERVAADETNSFDASDPELFAHRLVRLLKKNGRRDQAPAAAEVIREAVAAYLAGAEEGWEGYRRWAAETLGALSTVLSWQGDQVEAAAAAEEAVDLASDECVDIATAAGVDWDDEYAGMPISNAFMECRKTLVAAVIMWAARLNELDRWDEAIDVMEDAVDELRPPPGDLVYREFADLLCAHARLLEGAGRDAEAADVRSEAVDILREFTYVDGEQCPQVVEELRNQADLLDRLGRADEAAPLRREADLIATGQEEPQ